MFIFVSYINTCVLRKWVCVYVCVYGNPPAKPPPRVHAYHQAGLVVSGNIDGSL